ncbi:MAG: hypothetical protein ACTSXY_12425 [Promethearchaeota archaeon]
MNDERGTTERIIDFLEENKGETFSAAELAQYLGVVKNIIIKKLYLLIKHHEVKFKRVSCKIARKRESYINSNLKRGMNLYFLD